MPAFNDQKHGIEALVAQQVEEWALIMQASYDDKITALQSEQKETSAVVSRLSKYVNTLEFKVNYISKSVRTHQVKGNEEEEKEVPSSDLEKRITMLESFCGYVPEQEAYAALGLGTGELVAPEKRLSIRLDRLEKSILKLDKNIRQVETEVASGVTPEKHRTGNYNPVSASGVYFPEKGRPKSMQAYTQNRKAFKDGTSFTPHPPATLSYDENGHRIMPNKSRTSPRPNSAPHHAPKSPNLQKMMVDIRNQIEEVDDKNSMQNNFLMNEVIENVNAQEEKNSRKLMELREHVDEVEAKLRDSVDDLESNMRSKIMALEANVMVLRKQEKDGAFKTMHAKERKSLSGQVPEFERSTEDKETNITLQESLDKQEIEMQSKEASIRKELEEKEIAIKNMMSDHAFSVEENEKLKTEAKRLQEENAKIREDYDYLSESLKKEYESRCALVDERTELYKAEAERIKRAHQELQDQVNFEIKQRTDKLNAEKEALEVKLMDEVNRHKLQEEKESILKESLHNDIEMYKNSCNQAHQDRELALSKLQLLESKCAELESRVSAGSASPSRFSFLSKPSTSVVKEKAAPEDSSAQIPEPYPRVNGDRGSEKEQGSGDTTPSFDTPKVHPPRQQSFRQKGRGDTPIPQSKQSFFPNGVGNSDKTSFHLSPDTEVKKQASKDYSKAHSKSFRSQNGDEERSSEVDEGKLRDMVQRNLSQNDIDDIIVMEEMISEKEAELEQAAAAKSKAKKKIKAWMSDFQRIHKRPPNQSEKESVSDLYLNHQKLSEERDHIMAALEKMKTNLHEKVNKVAE